MKTIRVMYRILTWLLYVCVISTATLAIVKELSWWWVAFFIAVLLVDLWFYGRYIEAESETDI